MADLPVGKDRDNDADVTGTKLAPKSKIKSSICAVVATDCVSAEGRSKNEDYDC